MNGKKPAERRKHLRLKLPAVLRSDCKEDEHSCIAPLDPALKDGRSALRQHFVRGERAGQKTEAEPVMVLPIA